MSDELGDLQIHYLMQAARSLPSLPALAVTLHQSQTNPRMFARPCSKFLHCNISTFHDVDVLDSGGLFHDVDVLDSGGFSIHYPMGNVLDQPVILDTLPDVVVLDFVGLTGHVVRLGCRRGTAATRRGAISTQSVQNL
jgi:hypothetical protein